MLREREPRGLACTTDLGRSSPAISAGAVLVTPAKALEVQVLRRDTSATHSAQGEMKLKGSSLLPAPECGHRSLQL